MVVYICCAGGMTSSLFCSKIMKAAEEVDAVMIDIQKFLKNRHILKEGHDLVLVYGPADWVNPGFIRQNQLAELIDLVWICPQVSFKERDVRRAADQFQLPVELVNMKMFGKMEGDQALAFLQEYKKTQNGHNE